MADATKAAQEHAAEHGVDLDQVEGSGQGGRVTVQDVDNYVADRDAGDEGSESSDDAPETTDEIDGPINPPEVTEEETEIPVSEQQAVFGGQSEVPPDFAPGGPVEPEAVRERYERALPDEEGESELEQSRKENEKRNQFDAEKLSEDAAAQFAAKGEGGVAVRQVLAGSEANARSPLTQRPVEEGNQAHVTAQNAPIQTGETLPGERSVDNDQPAYQVAVTHVPGTPVEEQEHGERQPHPPTGLEDYIRIHEDAEAEQAEQERVDADEEGDE